MSLGTTAASRRRLKIALLVVVAAAMTMLLSQCHMVSDAVVAPGVSALQDKKPPDCLKSCQDAFLAAQNVEMALHKTNVKACNSDSLCLANEEARHSAKMDELEATRDRCQNDCHHQGGGTGGR